MTTTLRPVTETIDRFMKITEKSANVVLVKEREVIQWLYADLSFLPSKIGRAHV